VPHIGWDVEFNILLKEDISFVPLLPGDDKQAVFQT
jgi:hypothetical protein